MQPSTVNKYGRWLCLLLLVLLLRNNSRAQFFQFPEHQRKEVIPFKLIRNLIVVPVEINGQGPFNFVLDSGVGLVLITDPLIADSLQLNFLRNIKIVGLGGDDDLDAFISEPLSLSLGRSTGNYIPSAVLKKDVFNLSEYIGMPIHGLLGYEFFSSFTVRINYSSKMITMHPFKLGYAPRRGHRIPISIEERKPYIEAEIQLNKETTEKVKLIIDTGAGHPISLESRMGTPFPVPEINITANLGVGLSGPINGYLGRITALKMGKYELKKVISAFPNYNDVAAKVRVGGRNGNLGNQVLQQFEVVFDYSRNSLYLKPGAKFGDPFEHDMSGMEFYSPGPDYGRLVVNRVEPYSPAEEEGIKVGDEIISINLKPVTDYSAAEIDELFKSGDNRSFLLEILKKDSKTLSKLIFTLKRRI
jgi:hypothetical protein